LRWVIVVIARGLVHVRRAKNGTPSVQPLGGVELRTLRKLKREEIESRFVFMTERAAPITTAGYRKMIMRTGESAEFPFPVHPHMLRHARAYKGTETSSTRCDTRSCHPSGSKVFGMTTVRY